MADHRHSSTTKPRRVGRWSPPPNKSGQRFELSTSSSQPQQQQSINKSGVVEISDEDAMRALIEESKLPESDNKKHGQQRQYQRTGSSHHRDHPNGDQKSRQQHQSDSDKDKFNVDKSMTIYGNRKRGRDDDFATSQMKDEKQNDEAQPPPPPSVKPNFGLSGSLNQDDTGGKTQSNLYKGVVLKFQEPPEARAPKNTFWRLYVYKDNDCIQTLHVSKQSAYLFGRHADIADILIEHPSCSLQHAVLQHRAVPLQGNPLQMHCQPYLMDLESTNGTFINNVRVDSARYYQLKKGDVIKFGSSTREYVLMAA